MPKFKIIVRCEAEISYEEIPWLKHEPEKNPENFCDELFSQVIDGDESKIISIKIKRIDNGL
jgi:hypothetical protein